MLVAVVWWEPMVTTASLGDCRTGRASTCDQAGGQVAAMPGHAGRRVCTGGAVDLCRQCARTSRDKSLCLVRCTVCTVSAHKRR